MATFLASPAAGKCFRIGSHDRPSPNTRLGKSECPSTLVSYLISLVVLATPGLLLESQLLSLAAQASYQPRDQLADTRYCKPSANCRTRSSNSTPAS